MEEFRQRMQKALTLKHVKAVDLARAIKVDRSTISLWKSGKTKPRQDKIFLASKFLDVSPAWLMGADVPMEDFETSMLPTKDDEITKRLEDKIQKLSDSNKRLALGYVDGLLSQQKHSK